jgi:HK97 family phage portal protein
VTKIKIPIYQLISKQFDKIINKRMSEYAKEFLAGNDISGTTYSGVEITDKTALQISVFWSCTKILAEDVATLPVFLYKKADKGKIKAENHNLYQILKDEPNNEMLSINFLEMLMVNILLWGNCYIHKIYNNAGEIIELWPLYSQYMEIKRDKSGNLYYKYNESNNKKEFSKDEIINIVGLSIDGIQGLSIIKYAAQSLGLTISTEKFGSSFFKNGSKPSGTLELPEGKRCNDKSQVRTEWNQLYTGTENAGKIAILENGMKYKQIGIPPEDAQFLQTRQFQIPEVCRWFRMPPHKAGDLSNATFSNIEHQSIEYVSNTLRPWLVRFEKSLSKGLLTQKEKKKFFIQFNVDGLLRGDFNTRMQGYATARQNGWMNANDIRELEDLNPMPEDAGGDKYLVNGNMVPINEATNKNNKGGDGTNGNNTNSD